MSSIISSPNFTINYLLIILTSVAKLRIRVDNIIILNPYYIDS